MYNSPTLKALAAQPIVNNDITTVEIPTHLQEEMNDLKELQQIQQEIKYCKRKYDLLQEILEQIDGDIDYYYETEDFTEGIEYFRDCEKWFKNAENKVGLSLLLQYLELHRIPLDLIFETSIIICNKPSSV